MSDIEVSYAKIEEWYKKEPHRIFVISGYAGCGKTTLARSIPEVLGLSEYAFLTPTGIAATILSSGARTIHSFLYITKEDPVTKELIFMRKQLYEFEEDLIIVDEISMVNEELLTDLKRLQIPIIGLGDPAQLPPVNGATTILDNPDIFLTKVWRNDGGILDLATDVREGKALKAKYENVEFRRNIRFDLKLIDKESIVVCRYNKSRRSLNDVIRRKVYDYTEILHVGDKIMTLQNDKDSGLMNGSVVEILRFEYLPNELVSLYVKTIDNQQLKILVSLYTLKGLERPKSLDFIKDGRGRKAKIFEIDYAYAVTCHKAQGSEFKKVFVVREGQEYDDWNKWFYTAVTRAKEKLYIY